MYVKEFQNEMKETTKLVLAIEDLKIVQQHFYKYKLLEQKKAELGDKFTEDEFSISDRKTRKNRRHRRASERRRARAGSTWNKTNLK